VQGRPEVAIVGDDEQAGRASRTCCGPRLIDQVHEDLVRRAAPGVADDEARRDPLAAEPGLGRTVKDELDPDLGGDRRPEATDEGGLRRRTGSAREGVQQVGSVEDQAIGAEEWIAGRAHPRIVRAAIRLAERQVTGAATIGRVSLLLLVDLDGVVYRGADPVPGVAAVLADRAARGDDIVYVTNNSMHYRADYVARLSAMGCPISADRVVSSARATALYLVTHEAGIRRVLVVGAGGLERELRDVGLDVVTAAHAATRMH
jgi:Haloacid dehalogenase-like hydrolase